MLLVVFRTLNALLSFSAFVPDEYWQALEVAHRMVFGYPCNQLARWMIEKIIIESICNEVMQF